MMPRYRNPALAALCTALFLALPCPAAGEIDVSGAGGVKVNGALISQERIWAEYHFQITLSSFMHAKNRDKIDEKVLRSIVGKAVNRELLEQEARRLGYGLTEEDHAEVRRNQVDGWKGEGNFETAVKMMGVSEDFLLRRRESSFLRGKLARGEVGNLAAASEEELRAHYDANLGSYLPEEPAPLRYLFVPAVEGRSLQGIANEILREADALRRGGKDYASVVERHSRHESASRGGVVPEVSDGGERLPQQPAKLNDCRVKTRSDGEGLHIYLRDCRHPLPFEEVRSRVTDDLRRERERAFLRDTLSRLQKEGEIIYLPLSGEPPPPPGSGGH